MTALTSCSKRAEYIPMFRRGMAGQDSVNESTRFPSDWTHHNSSIRALSPSCEAAGGRL